jgi:hypothetical protein
MIKEVEVNPILELSVKYDIVDGEVFEVEILDIIKGHVNILYHEMAENRDFDKELEEKLLID